MIIIQNSAVEVAFDSERGNWLSVKERGGDNPGVIKRKGPAFDLTIDGKLFLGDADRRIKEYLIVDEGLGVRITYEKQGIVITNEIILDKSDALLRQKLKIKVAEGGLRKLERINYFAPALVVGHAEDCLLQAPGQIIPPDSLYTEYAAIPLDVSYSEPMPWYPAGWLEPAPDSTTGLVAIENKAKKQIVSVWQYSETATVFPTIDGKDGYIDVTHRHQLAAWLKPGIELESDGYCMLLTEGSFEEHLNLFRKHAYGSNISNSEDASENITDAVLLQINPRPISKWHAKLSKLKEIGFNMVYLMPIWSNQGNAYAFIDHYKLDQRRLNGFDQKAYKSDEEDPHASDIGVGSEEEMKAFVQEAHRFGIKVLFDFVPQGMGVHSPFIEEHSDWLVKDELERPFGSHGWGPAPGAPADVGTYSLDWGNPEVRKYAIDWAVWNLKTFDIDGFRTDALQWKEPNFSLNNTRQPWETVFGGVKLGEELRVAMKNIKKDAILLCELWGPIFQRSHDALYENGWLSISAYRGWLKGNPIFTAREWIRYLADTKDAHPKGMVRAKFSSNHDNQDVVDLLCTTPMGSAITFMNTFSDGFPFVWSEELNGREEFFIELFRERKRLSGYTCDYRIARSDSENLFTAVWVKGNEAKYLVVVNLIDKSDNAKITMDMPFEIANIVYGVAGAEVNIVNKEVSANVPGAGYLLVEIK